jgi:hypothetical protein
VQQAQPEVQRACYVRRPVSQIRLLLLVLLLLRPNGGRVASQVTRCIDASRTVGMMSVFSFGDAPCGPNIIKHLVAQKLPVQAMQQET